MTTWSFKVYFLWANSQLPVRKLSYTPQSKCFFFHVILNNTHIAKPRWTIIIWRTIILHTTFLKRMPYNTDLPGDLIKILFRNVTPLLASLVFPKQIPSFSFSLLTGTGLKCLYLSSSSEPPFKVQSYPLAAIMIEEFMLPGFITPEIQCFYPHYRIEQHMKLFFLSLRSSPIFILTSSFTWFPCSILPSPSAPTKSSLVDPDSYYSIPKPEQPLSPSPFSLRNKKTHRI